MIRGLWDAANDVSGETSDAQALAAIIILIFGLIGVITALAMLTIWAWWIGVPVIIYMGYRLIMFALYGGRR
jgi:hypothetical protein